MPPLIPISNRDVKARNLRTQSFPEYRDRYGEFDWDPTKSNNDHARIIKALLWRIQDSYDAMRVRHPAWKKIDQNLTSYIPLDEAEQAVKNADDRKPVRIVVPMSYATLDTLTAFYMSFLDDPIYRYATEGGSEGIVKSLLLQKHTAYQSRRYKHALGLHTLARDSFAYGIGAVSPVWRQKTGFKSFFTEDGERISEEVVQWEGNQLQSIDPYKLLPDPQVPIADAQEGEFLGWYDRTSTNSLLKEEKGNFDFFNVKYLKQIDARSNLLTLDDSGRSAKFGVSDFRDQSNIQTPVDVVYIYVDLVPSDEEWQLGSSDRPEKWLFAVAGDSVLIQAGPINLDHNMFPVAISAPDYDGHSTTPLSRLEITYGLQEAVDFLYNARLSNIRKMVNMLFVADPSLINMPDLQNTRDGMIARLRKDAWGRGLTRDALQALPVNDFSSTVFNDISWAFGVNDKTAAPIDQLQGVGGNRERVTAQEIQTLASSNGGKLQKVVQLMYWQYHYDLSYMVGSQTIQLADEEIWTDLVGENEEMLKAVYGDVSRIPIRPQDMEMGEVVIHDGSNPAQGDAQAWTQFFQAVTQDPELSQVYDKSKIAAQFFRMQGIKNPESLRRVQPQVVPDEQAQDQAAAGNIIPLNQAGGF